MTDGVEPCSSPASKCVCAHNARRPCRTWMTHCGSCTPLTVKVPRWVSSTCSRQQPQTRADTAQELPSKVQVYSLTAGSQSPSCNGTRVCSTYSRGSVSIRPRQGHGVHKRVLTSCMALTGKGLSVTGSCPLTAASYKAELLWPRVPATPAGSTMAGQMAKIAAV